MNRQTNYKTLFLFLFILISSFIVVAEPPFQTSEDTANELTIIVPKESAYALNEDIKLHFHVFNSTGYVLDVSQSDCRIHIYDHDGNHLIDESLEDGTETSVTVDKEIYLTKENLSGVGDYGFIVWCNSTQNEAGFISSNFLVTNNGEIASMNDLPLIIGIFIIVISLLIISMQLNNDHFLFKLLSQIFSLYFLWLIPNITLNSLSATAQVFHGLFTKFIYLFWIYLFVYLIYQLLDYMGKLATIKRGLNNISNKYKK